RSLLVGAARIKLLADQSELSVSRGRGRPDIRRHVEVPADRLARLSDGGARVERVEAHLAVLVEGIDPEVRHDDAGAPPEPALLAPDPLALLGSSEVAGARPEVDRLDEAAVALAHDHEHLPGDRKSTRL